MADNLVSKFTVNSQGTDIEVKIKDADARNLIAQEISDRSELIKKNESGDTVIETNNKIIETAHDKEENIADTYSRQVNGNSTVNVSGNATEVYSKTFDRTVTGNSNINVSGAATEVYNKTFNKTVTGTTTEQYGAINQTYTGTHTETGTDSFETYSGTKKFKVGVNSFQIEGKSKTIDLFKMENFVWDISAHGAEQNTDCTSIIQEGLNSGMPVFIPTGTWNYTTLVLSGGNTLFGTGNGSTTTSSTLINTGGTGLKVNGKNITIRDLNFENKNTNNNGISIAKDSQFFLIENVTCHLFNNGIYCNSQSWATISNAFCSDNTSAGFRFENEAGATAEPMQVNLINCLAENNNDNGFVFLNNSSVAMSCGTMLNCATFRNTGNGVIYGGTGGIAAVRINNCFFGNDGNSGLTIINAVYPCTISNTQFELAGTSKTGSQDHAATNDGKGIVVTASKSVQLSNCMFHTNSGIGAYVGDDSEAIITGCTFIHNTYNNAERLYDLYLQNSKTVINGNTFKSLKNSVYAATNANGTIIGNYFMEYNEAISASTMVVGYNVGKTGSAL